MPARESDEAGHAQDRDFRGWLEFDSAELCSEPHSTKLHDDLVERGLLTAALLFGMPDERRPRW